MSTTKPIRRVTIIGTGVIGASWAALYLAKGLEVVATDIAPNAEAALKRFVDAAWPALKRLGLAPGASQSKLSFTPKIEAAVSGADLVQENGPERLDFKQKLYGQLDDLLPAEVIIASSSSGLTMSEIQLGLPLPSRALRNRPSLQSSPSRPTGRNRGWRQDLRRDHSARRGILQALEGGRFECARRCRGMSPIVCRPPLSREVYYLVAEGVVSAADADTALCWGPGLRWGLMGNMLLNHLGGGEGGIEHFLEQFTRPLTAWWKTLGNPELTPEVQKKLIDSVHAEVGSRSIDSLAAERDEMLLGLLELRTRTEKAFQMDGRDAKVG